MIERNDSFQGPNQELWKEAQRIQLPPKQIYRIDGQGRFVEFTSDPFGIQKIYVQAIAYDKGARRGSRIKESYEFYWDFADAMAMAEEVFNDHFAKKVVADGKRKAKAEKKGEKYYSPDLYRWNGGLSQAALAKKGRARQDGKPLARSLRFMVSAREGAACAIRVECGPGKLNEATGGIVPEYGHGYDFGQPGDGFLSVAVSPDDLKRLAASLKMHVNGYMAASYASTAIQQENNYLLASGRR